MVKGLTETTTLDQTLNDLKMACASLSPRQNQEFEVGVFCGSYVTPVEDDYLEHLDRVRGKNKKLKAIEKARDAAVASLVGAELQVVANGAQMLSNGGASTTSTNGEPTGARSPTKGNGVDEYEGQPREQMDIALHNFRDYVR